MKMFRKDEGFTLVELMVVVLIIGILVAIAIPVFNSAQDNAKKRACFSNQRVIEGAAQQWVAAQDNSAIINDTNGNVVSGSTLVPSYIKVQPVCKNSNSAYSLTAGTTNCPAGATAPTGHGHY
jgi:prepilin-type N-terminal cleavage/methylation domain-containing protein